MTDNPISGRRPYGGAEEPPADAEQLPGERPLPEDEQEDTPPAEPDDPTEWSNRAPHDGGHMSEDQGGEVPGSATGPSSAGPPDAPGGPAGAGERESG